MEPRTRESVLEIVKIAHVCQYWRSTLISCPQLWSSIFVKNDYKDFVAACLERSRGVPLPVRPDLKYGGYGDCPNWPRVSGTRTNEGSPRRCYTSIDDPLLETDCFRRIRILDVRLAMGGDLKANPDLGFNFAFKDLALFASPLPIHP